MDTWVFAEAFHLEANLARSFQNAFYKKYSRALNIYFSQKNGRMRLLKIRCYSNLLQCGGLMEKADPELLKCPCLQPKQICQNCIECSHNYRVLTWFLHITVTFLLVIWLHFTDLYYFLSCLGHVSEQSGVDTGSLYGGVFAGIILLAFAIIIVALVIR